MANARYFRTYCPATEQHRLCLLRVYLCIPFPVWNIAYQLWSVQYHLQQIQGINLTCVSNCDAVWNHPSGEVRYAVYNTRVFYTDQCERFRSVICRNLDFLIFCTPVPVITSPSGFLGSYLLIENLLNEN